MANSPSLLRTTFGRISRAGHSSDHPACLRDLYEVRLLPLILSPDKGKLVVRRGRKAADLSQMAGLPGERSVT